MTALYGPAFLDGSSVGPFEVLLILATVLILFGPDRLPEIARKMGRMMTNFRRASDDLKSQIMRLDYDRAGQSRTIIAPLKPIVLKPAENSSPRSPPASTPLSEPHSDITESSDEVKSDPGVPT
jgi:TatA/E family protein of Tat protein translocase